MKKRIIVLAIIVIISLVLVLFQIPVLKDLFDNIRHAIFTYETYAKEISLMDIPLFTKSLSRTIFLFLLIIAFVSSVAYIMYKHIKGSNASNFVRYTYEEYKEYRANKKAKKQADKKVKLQAELDKIEKTE